MLRILFCLSVCVSVGALHAETKVGDWRQFRGPERTGLSSSVNLLTEWPEDGPPLVWKAVGAGRGYSSVAISNGRFVTMGDAPSTANDENEYLLCYDQKTGRQIWRIHLGKPWTDGQSDWQSSRSTPTIDGSRVFALTPHGDLVCCEMSDGSEVWRKNLKDDFDGKKGDPWGYSESVLIDGNRLICTPAARKARWLRSTNRTGNSYGRLFVMRIAEPVTLPSSSVKSDRLEFTFKLPRQAHLAFERPMAN